MQWLFLLFTWWNIQLLPLQICNCLELLEEVQLGLWPTSTMTKMVWWVEITKLELLECLRFSSKLRRCINSHCGPKEILSDSFSCQISCTDIWATKPDMDIFQYFIVVALRNALEQGCWDFGFQQFYLVDHTLICPLSYVLNSESMQGSKIPWRHASLGALQSFHMVKFKNFFLTDGIMMTS